MWGCMDESMDAWNRAITNVWIVRCTRVWMDGWMDVWMGVCLCRLCLHVAVVSPSVECALMRRRCRRATGVSSCALGCILGVWVGSWSLSEASWGTLGGVWRCLQGLSGPLGGSLDPLGNLSGLLEGSKTHQEFCKAPADLPRPPQ